MGRLTQVYTNGSLCSSYSYDAHGNRTAFTSATEAVTNILHDAQDRLLQYGDAVYSYNLAGDLTSATSASSVVNYSYDSFGNLLSAELNGTNIAYTVDPLNRRIGKSVNGTPVQKFIYQNQLNPVAELDGSNRVVSLFVYGHKGHVPAYMIQGTNTYRILSDSVGSVRLVVNADTGEVAQRIDYDEFGNVLHDTHPGFQPFGFQGGLYDRDTGLVRFGARDYDPTIGRWLTKDPLGFEAGINFYVFCGNDPVNFVDPYGLFRFGKRPLDGMPSMSQSFVDTISPVAGIIQKITNSELVHEHGFFEDGSGDNVGFGPNGRFSENPYGKSYRMYGKHYDDSLMREALKNLQDGTYNLLGLGPTPKNNCQDWADRLRNEYERLEKIKNGKP
jgi:RHS repeat-associated protein